MQNGYVPVTGLYATVDGQAYWLSNTVNMVPEAGMNYAYESQVVDLCNKERVAAGLLPLLWANELTDTAHLRARGNPRGLLAHAPERRGLLYGVPGCPRRNDVWGKTSPPASAIRPPSCRAG